MLPSPSGFGHGEALISILPARLRQVTRLLPHFYQVDAFAARLFQPGPGDLQGRPGNVPKEALLNFASRAKPCLGAGLAALSKASESVFSWHLPQRASCVTPPQSRPPPQPRAWVHGALQSPCRRVHRRGAERGMLFFSLCSPLSCRGFRETACETRPPRPRLRPSEPLAAKEGGKRGRRRQEGPFVLDSFPSFSP